MFVHVGQRVGDVTSEARPFVHAEVTSGAQEVFQRAAREVLADHGIDPCSLAPVKDAGQVRVTQLRRPNDPIAKGPANLFVGREIGKKNLDRDATLE